MPWRQLTLVAVVAAWLVPWGPTAERADAQTSCQRSVTAGGSSSGTGFSANATARERCPGSTGGTATPSPGGSGGGGSSTSGGVTGPRCTSQAIASGTDFRQTFTGGSEFGLVMGALPSLPSGLGLADATLNDRDCDDGSGGLFWTGPPGSAPTPAAGPGSAPVFEPPEVVAERLFLELSLPQPEPRIDAGLATQLEARLSVANESLETSAPLQGLTLGVTATPIDQSWEIAGVPGGAPPVVCEPDRRPPEQECTWTPNHSSATVDPVVAGERDGSPCFPVTITVTWAGAFTVDGADGGDLGTRESTHQECLVVGEIQALNG